MPAIGYLSAWIEVDGVRLPEYDVRYSPDGSKVSCWVPSEAGKAFVVCYEDSLRTCITGTIISVDGNSLPDSGRLIYPLNISHPHARMGPARHYGVASASHELRPFIFANCELTEEEDFMARNPARIGQILCTVSEFELRGQPELHPIAPHDLPALRVHERAKKGIVHGIQLGNAVKTVERTMQYATHVRPLVMFGFKYRPMAVLMADGIVPNVNAVPQPRHIEVIDLTVGDEEDNNNLYNHPSPSQAHNPVKREIKREWPEDTKWNM